MRNLSLKVAVTCLVAVLAILGVWLVRKPVLIAFYKQGMHSARAKVLEVGAGDSRQGDYIMEYDRCRDKLVGLGYLARKEFYLKHISAPSEESKQLWLLLQKAFPDNIHAQMDWQREVKPAHITVWDRPERIPAWEDFISKHDVPDFAEQCADKIAETETIVSSDVPAPSGLPDDCGSFHGQWMVDGEVILEITHKEGKKIQVSAPANDTWRSEFKNIKLDGSVLQFDNYNYTPPDSRLQTFTNPTGEHPFNGVRCHYILTIDQKDSNLIHYTLTASSIPFEDRGEMRRRPTWNQAYLTAERYAEGWTDLGMWLPSKEEARFFATHTEATQLVLTDRLKHSNADVRQAAAYVVEQIGPIARHLSPNLVEALENEHDPLVRIYLINALRAIGNDDEQVLEALPECFAPPTEEDRKTYEATEFLIGALENKGEQYDELVEMLAEKVPGLIKDKERICAAAALFVLSPAESERRESESFVCLWLRPPSVGMRGRQLERYWDARWSTVNAVQHMVEATKAIPLLEAMLIEENSKPWVQVHVPRALRSLRPASSQND